MSQGEVEYQNMKEPDKLSCTARSSPPCTLCTRLRSTRPVEHQFLYPAPRTNSSTLFPPPLSPSPHTGTCVRLAPSRLACPRLDRLRSAPVKSAFSRLAPNREMLERLEPLKLAPFRLPLV